MLNHQNIIKFKDLFEENNRIIIVTELAEHGSLKKLIDERILNKQNFEVEEIMNIFIQLLLGVQHMHENKVFHRDIKPDNIFLGYEGKIKIGDFGISRIFNENK